MDHRVTNTVAITITIVWAASFLADIAIDDYSPSPFIHTMMMALAGSAFGRAFLRDGSDILPPFRRKRDDDKEKAQDE